MSSSLLPMTRPEVALEATGEEGPPPGSTHGAQRLLRFVIRFWWIPVVAMIVGIVGAAVYIRTKPPKFVSTGRMWETVKMRLPEGSLFSEEGGTFLGTQTELLQSTALRDLALARLKSSTTNFTVPLGKDGQPLPVSIRVGGGTRSSVYVLEATSSNELYSRAYLDALMHVYLEYKKNVRKVVSGDTLNSISEQVHAAERDLKAEMEIFSSFQRTNTLASLEGNARDAGAYLNRLRTQLADLQLEYKLLTGSLASTNDAPQRGTNANPTEIAAAEESAHPNLRALPGASPEYNAALKDVEMLRMQREKLSEHLRPKHPKILRLDSDLDRSLKLIEIMQRQSRDQLAASKASILKKMENISVTIAEWESKVMVANARMNEGERIKFNVTRLQGVYERLATLLQNVGISRNIDQETLAILEPASVAKRTFQSEVGMLGAGAFGGLGFGLGIIFLIAMRDDRFAALSEISEKLGEHVVGQIPQIEPSNSDSDIPLLELDDNRHAYAESFRGLRSALLFMSIESERPKSILVTSAVPHEGKSTVAMNLARALAFGGSRVLLVDADMRKGGLHRRLGLSPGPGLSEALRNDGDCERMIQQSSLPNLAFIGCGSTEGHPGDVFTWPVFDEVLARFKKQFDHVVIDSSPVFAADDAATLAPKVDATLFVVRSRFSRPGPSREALNLLYQRNAKIFGVVFNQSDHSARSNYYYKYDQYYGKGSGKGGKQGMKGAEVKVGS